MNINQKFHLRQDNHEITFFAYDIDFVDKITPYNLSKIYVPDCETRDIKGGCDQRGIKELCCVCSAPHYQELLMDGWYVGDRNGVLTDDSYYAMLQSGIRVPVCKEIYDAWKAGWSKEPYSSGRARNPMGYTVTLTENRESITHD